MAKSHRVEPHRSEASDESTSPPQRAVVLGGDQVGRLCAALEDAFTLDQLRQLLVTGLEGNLSLSLDAIVPVQNRNLHDICYDLVRWSLRDERVGLQGLLAAAVRTNPGNPQLQKLHQEWAGVTFTAPPCPYPGMKPFATADRGRFYGRTAEIQGAVDRLRRDAFLAVIGPSGSGKSSLLAAGILPALEQSHYFADKPLVVRTMRPGATPCDTLAALLDPVVPADGASPGDASQTESAIVRLLLVVDQYEELFTTAPASQREPFEQALLQRLQTPDFYLVLAARADFYSSLMASPLWDQIREHRLEITPPRGDALRKAIALPARDVGVELEPQLVERLLADAGEEPGVLPFIQETLVMLWSHATSYAIGLAAYTDLVGDKSGRSGLQVALAEHAEHVYQRVLASDAERASARRILLRLIQFGEGRADTRRQQTVAELRKGSAPGSDKSSNRSSGAAAPLATFDQVLAALTANRLLTLSDEARQVDLSHEALIRGWPRLHTWIDERRAAELTRRRLEEKAAERQRLRQGAEAGGLLDAVELAEAEAWVKGPDAAELGVSDELASLVTDSRRAIDTAVLEKERAAERLRRRNQGLAIALAAALVAMAVAVVFFLNARTAESAANKEAENARNAEARAQSEAQVALTAQAFAQTNANQAATQEARAQANAHEAEAAQQAAQQAARRAKANELAAYAQDAAATAPNDPSLHLLLAMSAVTTTWPGDHYISPNADRALRDAVALAPPYRATLSRHLPIGAVYGAAYSPDGKTIATAGGDHTVMLWEAATGKLQHQLTGHDDTVLSAAFSPDGQHIVTSSLDQTARIWDVASGAELFKLMGHEDWVRSAVFSPDGKTVVTASDDGTARVWDAATGAQIQAFTGHAGPVFSAAFRPDGKAIVTAGRDQTARIWDVATGQQIGELAGHGDWVRSAAFSPDGKWIVTTSDDLTAIIWDAGTGQQLRRLEGHNGTVSSAVFSPDGKNIVTASAGSDSSHMGCRHGRRTARDHGAERVDPNRGLQPRWEQHRHRQ